MPEATTLLKLGGSLITDKNIAETFRKETTFSCLKQVKRWLDKNPGKTLVLGHGSGSFGHVAGKRYGTRSGVQTPQEWLGYSEVWYSARKLNDLFIESCHQAGLPVIDFPVSAFAISTDKDLEWETEPLKTILAKGLIPVVHGDVCIDPAIGGTILSTEEIFLNLSREIAVSRVLLAGVEDGVYADFPIRKQLYETFTRSQASAAEASSSVDVTGGMASKIASLFQILENAPKAYGLVFSGLPANNIYNALCSQKIGTKITAS